MAKAQKRTRLSAAQLAHELAGMRFQEEGLTAAEELVGMVLKTVKVGDDEKTTQVTVRLPNYLLALVDSIAEEAGISRAKAMIQLQEIGVEELYVRLPKEAIDRIYKRVGLGPDRLKDIERRIREHDEQAHKSR